MTPADIIRPRAYSYVRFSTPEQAAGDSLRRQTEKARKYAAEHGLVLDDKLNMHDLGVPAFRGANVAMGALGNFLSLVQSGDIAPGSYLLAENIDRISRAVITEAMAVLTMLINSGITLVTLGDERAYSKEIINRQPFAIMEIIMGFIRANDESARKQGLLREAWHGKRLKLKEGKPLTKLCPSWLRLKNDRTGYEVIEEHADVVRRVYYMTLAGKGQHSIATTFNREKVQVFGNADRWHGAYVNRLLNSEAVVGRFTPRKREYGKEGKMTRPAAGDTVEGYFPAIIDMEIWERVRSMTSGRPSYASKGTPAANILSGLATCPQCGATMTRVNKGAARGTYLVCVRAKNGAGCEYKSVPYQHAEDAIVEKADEFQISLPSPDEKLEEEWQRLLADDEAHADAIGNIVEAIKRAGPSETLLESLRQVEADREDIKRRLVEVGEQVTASLTNRTQQTVERLIDATRGEGRDVAAINANLRQLFSKVEVDWSNGQLWFHWKHAPREVTGIMFAWPEKA